MRFLSIIGIDENSGRVPSEQLMSDMGTLIEEITREGVSKSTATAVTISAPSATVRARPRQNREVNAQVSIDLGDRWGSSRAKTSSMAYSVKADSTPV